jgi:preprotein translocase subunit SecG
MFYILLILILIACVLLAITIISQNQKRGDVSSLNANASEFLGTRQTADFMERSSWYFGIGILLVVAFAYFFLSH